MKDKRIVNFYYFRPYLFDGKGEKEPFNFAEWIINFEKENRIYTANFCIVEWKG